MRLIPKYKGGNKTYQFRRYGDVDLPANIRILDERGLEISPNENTKILTDSDGNPINRSWLVANGYHYSPSPDTIYANTPLDEVTVTAEKKKPTVSQKIGKFINDELLLNKGNIRVINYRKALQKNPNFSHDWDMVNNGYDFLNMSSAGLLNRLSPTQNIGFAIDAAQGDNLWDSWLGNSGIVSDKFMQEHPWWSLAINGAGDAGMYLASSKFKPKSKRFSALTKSNKGNSIPISLNSSNNKFKTYPLSESLDIQWERWKSGGAKEKLKTNVDNLPDLSKKDKMLLDKLRQIQDTFSGDVDAFDKYTNFALSKKEQDRIRELADLGYINGFNNNTYDIATFDPLYNNNAAADIAARGFVEGTDKKFTNNVATRAHELSHMAYIPTEPIPTSTYNANAPRAKYLFLGGNGTESSARLTQLKNYFGLRKDEPITPEMFEYAKKNYVNDTGRDNNMIDWFNGITDVNKFLDWANKHSWMVTVPFASKAIVDKDGKVD